MLFLMYKYKVLLYLKEGLIKVTSVFNFAVVSMTLF